MTSLPAPSRRERQHAATVEEIRAVARRLLVEGGAASLTLRAVAREMGMTPSGLYRYYDSRDALLTALVVETFDELGEVVEQVAAGLAPGADPVASFLDVAHAMRDWALARTQEYGLLFGTPVPGYEPPEETLGHELRVPAVLLDLLRRAIDSGAVRIALQDDELDPALRGALHDVCDGKFAGLTPAGAALALSCWSTLLGAIGAEVFGHLPPQVALAPRELFTLTMVRHLRAMGFVPA